MAGKGLALDADELASSMRLSPEESSLLRKILDDAAKVNADKVEDSIAILAAKAYAKGKGKEHLEDSEVEELVERLAGSSTNEETSALASLVAPLTQKLTRTQKTRARRLKKKLMEKAVEKTSTSPALETSEGLEVSSAW